MGTTLKNVLITEVVDGDTIRVRIDDEEHKIRIGSVDTEESNPGGSKPVTKLGIETAKMAKQFFTAHDGSFTTVDLEFDTGDSIEQCFIRHRDNYGRLICYVHRGGENYNLRLIREGWSPYFVKYGRSRLYHTLFTDAEAEAQAMERGVWNHEANAGGPSRDYAVLLPWWAWRAHIIEGYREKGIEAGSLSVRLDYKKILDAVEAHKQITVFCDLQHGIAKRPGNGALINAGSRQQPFNLWIPDAQSKGAVSLIRLVEKRYAGYGRGYAYVSGRAEMYRDTPEIELTELSQLSDFPPYHNKSQ